MKSVAKKFFVFLSTLTQILSPVRYTGVNNFRKGYNGLLTQNRRPALPAGSRHCNDRVRPVERRSRYGIIKGDPPVYGVCWDWIREIFRF